MKPRKQRLHSAELRRLDHIAGSLDRIASALERMPGAVANGDNDIVIDNMVVKAGEKSQFALRGLYNASGISVKNSQGVLLNGSDNSVASSGTNHTEIAKSGNHGSSAAGSATATTLDKHPTTENKRINVDKGVGEQLGGTTKMVEKNNDNTDKYENFAQQGIAAKNIGNVDRSTEIDSDDDNTSQVVEGSGSNANHSTVSGESKHISGVSGAFNTNANDVVKDLTAALHRSTVQRLDQHKE